MSALLEKIRASKAASNERPQSQQINVADISLRGTGLTKREAEKNTRAYERETARSVKAEKTLFVSDAEKQFQAGIEQTIRIMREENALQDIKYDESQLRAIAGIMHNQVSVLIGAAGTGKTTITRKIIQELAKRVNVVDLKDVTFVYARQNEDAKQERILLRDALARKMIIQYDDRREIQEDMPGIAMAAYTGRASQQTKKAVPEEWRSNVSTIHRLLGYAPVFEDFDEQDPITKTWYVKTKRIFRPTFDASLKLPFSVFVLDEASMIPIPLFNEIIDAIHETSRILLIGDIHQLPPVYGKSVLGYAMRKWPVYELTTIHRQAAGNAIISNAHNVLRGKMIEEASNFKVIGRNSSPPGSGALQKYFLQVIAKLAELKRYDPMRDAIIVPQNKDMVGSIELNSHLVTMFNPEQKENGVIVNKRIAIHTGTGHVYFAIRDKVMITSNINTVEPPITNGMVGIIESININGKYDMKRAQVEFGAGDDANDPLDLDLGNLDIALGKDKNEDEKEDKNDETTDQRQSSHVLTIKFENGQTYSCSTAGDFRRITHGYAATCHKSQGGEYPNVIILCHSVNARMLSQEWLYTAITRARDNVYIVCNERGLTQALTRQVIKGKTLKEKIQSYIIETKSDDDMSEFNREKYPILWSPKELN